MKIGKVIFYISGDVVKDIGIVYFHNILKNMGITPELKRNYLEFDYVEPEKISGYILDKLVFDVFKNGKADKLFEIFGEVKELTVDNFLDEIDKSNARAKDREELVKAFNSRRFPYIRNSGKYGLNTSLENMEKNFRKLTEIVMGYKVNKADLTEYKEKEDVCTICNFNKVTELDVNLKEKKDSKLNFLFRGSEESGFRNNGSAEGSICFECEFFNLMCLLYISLERPVTLAYTNDLTELSYVNYKIMLERRLTSDKAFYNKLARMKLNSLRTYDFDIDANKGIILRFNSIIDYKNLIKKIELYDIIDNYYFSRESGTLKKLCKVMTDNNSLISLKETLLSNVVYLKSEGTVRNIAVKETLYNIQGYIKALCVIENKEGSMLQSNLKNNGIYSKTGGKLAYKMDENKKKNLVFKIVQLLKANNKKEISQIILHSISAYSLPLYPGFVEGILFADDLQVNANVMLFVQELLIEHKDQGSR